MLTPDSITTASDVDKVCNALLMFYLNLLLGQEVQTKQKFGRAVAQTVRHLREQPLSNVLRRLNLPRDRF
mgnify:CR=1 FL=1